MQTDPRLYAAQNAAAAARNAARQPAGAPRGFIDGAWQEMQRRTNAAFGQGIEAQIAVAHEAAAVMNAIAAMSADSALWAKFGALENRSFGSGGDHSEEIALHEAAIASSPVLAKFYAEWHEQQRKAAEERAASAVLQAENEEKQAPARMLVSLRSRGIHLALSESGKQIVVPPDQWPRMSASELDGIRERRAGIVAFLKAEAEAARPVVIA